MRKQILIDSGYKEVDWSKVKPGTPLSHCNDTLGKPAYEGLRFIRYDLTHFSVIRVTYKGCLGEAGFSLIGGFSCVYPKQEYLFEEEM